MKQTAHYEADMWCFFDGKPQERTLYEALYEKLDAALPEASVKVQDLPVKSVEIISCRGLTSFYAMQKGLIIGY